MPEPSDPAGPERDRKPKKQTRSEIPARTRYLDIDLPELFELAAWFKEKLDENPDGLRAGLRMDERYFDAVRRKTGNRFPFVLAANVDHIRRIGTIPNPIYPEAEILGASLAVSGVELKFLIIEGPHAGRKLNYRIPLDILPAIFLKIGCPRKYLGHLTYKHLEGLRTYVELRTPGDTPVITQFSVKHRANKPALKARLEAAVSRMERGS